MRLDHITYHNIISVENLLASWQEFLRGKRKRKYVEDFSLYLLDNILLLHRELHNRTYRHGGYYAFKISDPKPRDIHKASVRDRLLHHAIYRVIYPYFNQKFIFDSFSCRRKKGTHRAINRFGEYGNMVSKNKTKTVWILKCDILKFFASIDHKVLKNILAQHIADSNMLWLLNQVIGSFHIEGKPNVGLPLGNLTSQLLVNIYMNEFDHFIKQKLKIKYYIRYADDFIIFHKHKQYLENLLPKMSEFLKTNLKLFMHPDKITIKTLASGIDFLGWIHSPCHRVLRTSTKRRMFKKMKHHFKYQTLISYIGLLSHGNSYKIKNKLLNLFSGQDKINNQVKSNDNE